MGPQGIVREVLDSWEWQLMETNLQRERRIGLLK